MDCRTFYGRIRPTTSTIALLPADTCDSEAEDLSDPEDENDADYVPPPSEDLLPPPKKRRNMNRLVEVSSDLYQNPSPPAKSKPRKWVKKDIPAFTVPKPVFTVPELVSNCYVDLSTSTITSRWGTALAASTRSAVFLTCSENNASSFHPPTGRVLTK